MSKFPTVILSSSAHGSLLRTICPHTITVYAFRIERTCGGGRLFCFFLYPAFSAFPEGSKEGDSFPDGCSRPGSHLFEVPEKAGGNGDVKDLEDSKSAVAL